MIHRVRCWGSGPFLFSGVLAVGPSKPKARPMQHVLCKQELLSPPSAAPALLKSGLAVQKIPPRIPRSRLGSRQSWTSKGREQVARSEAKPLTLQRSAVLTEDYRGGRKTNEVEEVPDCWRDDFLKRCWVCSSQCLQQKHCLGFQTWAGRSNGWANRARTFFTVEQSSSKILECETNVF